MPGLNPEYADKVETFKSWFQGDPAKVLIQVEGAEGGYRSLI